MGTLSVSRVGLQVIGTVSPPPPPNTMKIPSGAFYLDHAYEQDDEVITSPLLINTFPYNGETAVPASDRDGTHPLYLTIIDFGSDGMKAGQTTIDAVVGYLATYASPSFVASTPTVSEVDNLIDVRIGDEVAVSENVHMGIKEHVFDGSSFATDWATDSSYVPIASDGGATVDEHRFILFRSSAFESLQHIALDIYAETDNVSPAVLSTSYAFTIEDLTKPELLSVWTRGLTQLRVKFSEAMEQGTGVAGDSILVRALSAGVEIAPPGSGQPARVTSYRSAFLSTDVGLYLGIAGAENALNNDIFQIVSVISDTQVEIDRTDVIDEVLPIDAVVTVSPYRVNGVPDDALVNPYFNPVVTAAEAITIDEIELTLHTEITPSRAYNFHATSVNDLYENSLDPVSLEFTTEALDVPQARLDRTFSIPEMIPWGNRRPDEDASRDLERFLNCLDEMFQFLLHDIDKFVEIMDVDLISGGNLDALLVHLGAPFTFTADLSETDKRKLASTLVDAYKRKGVEAGMEAVIAIILGITADIHPYYDPDSFWSLGVSALGYDTILGPGSEFLKYSFEVEVTENLTETQRRRLTEIIEWMKPAHTHYVRLIEPGFQHVINDLLFTTDSVAAEVILGGQSSDAIVLDDEVSAVIL